MDGKLELAELRGGPQSPGTMLKKAFPMVDTNKDGFIDIKEQEAAMKLMPQRGRSAAAAAAPVPNASL